MRDSQRGTGSRRSNLTVVKIILIDGSLQTRLESSGAGEGRSGRKPLGLNPADHYVSSGQYSTTYAFALVKNEITICISTFIQKIIFSLSHIINTRIQ